MNARTGADADGGRIEDVSVPQVLVDAWRLRRTGTLRLIRGQTETRIQIEDGAPTAIETDRSEDHFAQILADARSITASQRLEAERFAAHRECSQANAVHALGFLDAKALYHALRNATRLQIGELFDWRNGEWAWSAAAPESPDAKTGGKGFDVLKLIQEQLPRRWGIDRLYEALMPRSEEVFELVPSLRRIAEKLGATGAMARKMIEGLDGQRSIGRLLGESSGDPLAATTLWILLNAGLLREPEARPNLADQTLEFEVVVADTPARAAKEPSAATESSDDATGSTAVAAANPKAEALREEIAAMLRKLGELTHYEALGLESDATAAAFKKAYFKAAKKYHPDTLASLGLADLRADAAKVFGRIAEAFETLSNPEKRTAYDSGANDEDEIDTARLTQAETSFRKGEILLKMGNFKGALPYLESAVELWPEEPAYQAALGWVLLKQPKPNAARARAHLSQAHEQEPDNALTLMRLSRALRGLGQMDDANACAAKARTLDPNVKD